MRIGPVLSNGIAGIRPADSGHDTGVERTMGGVPTFPHGRPLTWADLEAMPDDGHRFELVDGVLVMSPSPRPVHQRVVARLLVALTAVCPPELEVLPAPVDVVLADDTVFIPDLVVGRREQFSKQALIGPPVLAVEVLSPRTRHVDLELKRAKFQEVGCENYWVIDYDSPWLRCLHLENGVYVEQARSEGEEIIELQFPFAVKLSAQSLVR
ncbi:Endonuclease, Uma2 family (restriction endonuclease fold) [Lentzea albidocapillata subsp. violacea]|uniref:Endonuclease, Uma2 family (Restriction endonuclease fold) n=2 Tax=Lentzea albidocapillata TaxID=40571 RepID=A0A1G9J180_9PSEU|nr:Endonuclease, Uma2 family (restriction endonuclease fold) [Lentzea albidocapillata subsp. violacea]